MPSTTLAVETASSIHSVPRSASNDPVIVAESNWPATALPLRSASCCIGLKAHRLPARTRIPVPSFTQAQPAF